jgi:hypothetical protein
MRIIELLNSLTIPINNEESAVLEKFNESESIAKSSLEPREQLLANGLVTKDILTRRRDNDGKIVFTKKIR